MPYYSCTKDKNGIHQYFEVPEEVYAYTRQMENENMLFRKILWLNHGHTGMYGDDGEMQCSECLTAYGFWDWKRTPISEIESRIHAIKKKGVIKCSLKI